METPGTRQVEEVRAYLHNSDLSGLCVSLTN